MRISGSTMGTSPLSWQMAAYLARVSAVSWMESGLGVFSLMRKTARHLAKRQPAA